MMKILFLDNDGVICMGYVWGSRKKKWKNYRAKVYDSSPLMDEAPVQYRFDNFDKKAIKILNEILDATGAEIVVSSDWKRHATLEELGDYYEMQGIKKRPIALTPNLEDFDDETNRLFLYKKWYERIRVLEIRKYLEEAEVSKWVVVDDMDLGAEGLENFIITARPSTEGIKQSGLKERIINALNDGI
jgi:hypothetical protein